MSEVNLFDVEVQKDDDDAPGYHTSYARVGPLIGGAPLGLSVYELPPGQSICPYHYEIGFEEWLLVLTGRPTLRTPEGERELRPWDVAFFPDGEDGRAQGDERHRRDGARRDPLEQGRPRRGDLPRLEQGRRLGRRTSCSASATPSTTSTARPSPTSGFRTSAEVWVITCIRSGPDG